MVVLDIAGLVEVGTAGQAGVGIAGQVGVGIAGQAGQAGVGTAGMFAVGSAGVAFELAGSSIGSCSGTVGIVVQVRQAVKVGGTA